MNYKIFFLFVFVLLTSFSNIPSKPNDNLKITETIKLPGSKVISSYNELNANSDKTPSFESYSIALEGFYKLKEKGLVTKRFGLQPHPVEKSIMIESNGVEITTEKGGRARAVFSGQVVDIQLMPNNTAIIMVRHGNYTTVYSNVINLVVRKGDHVNTKQDLGEIHYNELLGKAVLKFLIYENSFKQDPQHWIYNM